ncbi:hypothetical protein GCM10010440_15530 [Kitasatospora cinereorecta]
MDINDTGPGPERPRLQPCPSCGLSDRVTGVPAVYLAGRDQVTEVVPARGDDPRRTVTRQVTSALSAALAPAPARRTSPFWALSVLAGLVSIATFIGGAASGHWFSDEQPAQGAEGYWTTGPDGNPMHVTYGGFVHDAVQARPNLAFLGWISALALLTAVVLLVAASRRRAEFQELMTGRPAAERLWAQAWYCDRCGTAHFPAAAAGEPSRALTLQEFRAVVWEAGGYGDMARQQPVV